MRWYSGHVRGVGGRFDRLRTVVLVQLPWSLSKHGWLYSYRPQTQLMRCLLYSPTTVSVSGASFVAVWCEYHSLRSDLPISTSIRLTVWVLAAVVESILLHLVTDLLLISTLLSTIQLSEVAKLGFSLRILCSTSIIELKIWRSLRCFQDYCFVVASLTI